MIEKRNSRIDFIKASALLWLGGVYCVLFLSSVALAKEYTIKQIAEKTVLNREPVISESGLIAWYAYAQNKDESSADIYIYRNGVAEKLTKGKDNTGIHPYIHKNTIVWEGTLSEEIVVSEEVKAPPAQPMDAQGTNDVDPSVTADSQPVTMVSRTIKRTGAGICRWSGDKVTAVSFSLDGAAALTSKLNVSNALMQTESKMDGEGAVDVASPVCWNDTTVWQKANVWPCGWEIMVGLDGIQQQLMTNCYYDMGPQIYENSVVWYGWDGQDFEIYMFDVSTGITTQLTDNGYDDMSPVIWDDLVAWEGYPAVEADVFIWKAGEIKVVSDNLEDDVNPRIWNGMVVWQGMMDDNYEIFLYDGQITKRLTDNDYDDVDPDIRDSNICWVGYEGNWDAEVFLLSLDESTPTILTDNDYEDHHPRTAIGKVVWEAKREGLPLIYVAEPR